jgi:MscS family membrane protein
MTGRRLTVALAVVLASARLVGAQPPTSTSSVVTPSTTTPPSTVAGADPYAGDVGFTSPRSTMRGFLRAAHAGDWDEAATYLDLRRIPKDHRAQAGPLFARQVYTVLDRTLWVDLDALSDAPEGDRDDGLPARRELVGTIRTAQGPVDVVLERAAQADGTLGWKIAAATVSEIPDLYAEFGNGWLESFLPTPLLEIRFLSFYLWQWIALVLVSAAGLVLGWLTSGIVLRLLGLLVPEERRTDHDRLLGGLTGPLRLLIALFVVSASVPFLALSVPAAARVALVRKTLSIIGITWLALRMGDVLAAIADSRLRAHGRAAAVSVVPLGRRTLKAFIAVIAALAVVQNLGYDATGILAGLGIGGLALALAAQKTVENLLGGVMLITDQPVRVGDLCRFGTRTGTVEDIGFRSTRVRTPERTVVSIPNAEFASTQIENLALRDRMQLTATLPLRIDTTAAQLRRVLNEIRLLVDGTARIDRTSSSVRLATVGASSLDVEITAYVLTRSWDEFLAIREDVLLRVLELLEAAEVELSARPGALPAPAPSTR